MSRQRLAGRLNASVIVVAVVVTIVDAVTKLWARHALAHHAVHVVGPLWLRLQYNAGISFSLNRSGPLVTTIATAAVAVAVVVVGVKANRGLATAGFGMLIGGGVANVIDRVSAVPHEVTDFIAVSSFPVFNVADASITVGFIILVVAAIRGDKLLAW